MPSTTPALGFPYPLSGDPAAPHTDMELLAEAIEAEFLKRTPVGSITAYAGATAPTGWLLCAGQVLDVEDYPALAAVLEDTYGGDGVTTFGVPDLRGRVPVGLDNMTGVDAGRLDVANTLGATGGAQTHTLVTGELAAHSHPVTVDNTATAITASSVAGGSHAHSASAAAVGDHAHSAWTDTHPGHAHNVNPTYGNSVVAGTDAAGSYGGNRIANGTANRWLYDTDMVTDTQGAHGHGVGIGGAGSHSHTITVDAGGSHSHTINVSNPAHGHAASSSNTGGGGAHNNMQPYMLLNTIIRAA